MHTIHLPADAYGMNPMSECVVHAVLIIPTPCPDVYEQLEVSLASELALDFVSYEG